MSGPKILNPEGDVDLYCRLSMVKTDKLATVGVQERYLIKEAKRWGLTPRAVHVDDGISAWNPDKTRPGYLGLLGAIKRGAAKAVMAVDLDRFTRQVGEVDALLIVAAQTGCRLIAGGTEIDPSSPMAVAMAQIGGVLAQMESSTKSGRIKRALEEQSRQGRRHGGRRPFGYNDDGLTPHPTEAPVYVELVERIANGESSRTVARDFAARGIVSQTGKPFSPGRLRILVRSPRHAGFASWHGEIVGEGQWKPLITPELQARALAMLHSNSTNRMIPSDRRPALLQGMLTCGVRKCDERLAISRRPNAKSTRAYDGTKTKQSPRVRSLYTCPEGHVSIEMHRCDEEVEERFLAALGDAKTRKMLKKVLAEQPSIGAILGRIDLIEADIAMHVDMLRDDEIDRAVYRSAMRDLKAKKEAAERELSASRVPTALTLDPDVLKDKWGGLTLEEKRANITSVVNTITVHKHKGGNRKEFQPERIEIDWR